MATYCKNQITITGDIESFKACKDYLHPIFGEANIYFKDFLGTASKFYEEPGGCLHAEYTSVMADTADETIGWSFKYPSVNFTHTKSAVGYRWTGTYQNGILLSEKVEDDD